MAKKLDKLVERMRKIMPPQEFETWLLDYNVRNANAAGVRKAYLRQWDDSMAQMKRADFQHPTPGTHVVDGYLAVDGEPELEGFDIITGSCEPKPSPGFSQMSNVGSDGWKAAPVSKRTPRIIPFDSENDEEPEPDEPGEVQDWSYLADRFVQKEWSIAQLAGHTHISDAHIEYHRCELNLLPKGARHNSRLGRRSYEDPFVKEMCVYALKNNSRAWLIGTNLFE